MKRPKSLTGVFHLPDARLHFYLSFDEKSPNDKPGGDAGIIGRILDKTSELSPDLQELLIAFADQVRSHARKAPGNGEGEGQGHDTEKTDGHPPSK